MIENFYTRSDETKSSFLSLVMHGFCEFMNSDCEDYYEIIEMTLESIYNNINEMNEATEEKRKQCEIIGSQV